MHFISIDANEVPDILEASLVYRDNSCVHHDTVVHPRVKMSPPPPHLSPVRRAPVRIRNMMYVHTYITRWAQEMEENPMTTSYSYIHIIEAKRTEETEFRTPNNATGTFICRNCAPCFQFPPSSVNFVTLPEIRMYIDSPKRIYVRCSTSPWCKVQSSCWSINVFLIKGWVFIDDSHHRSQGTR